MRSVTSTPQRSCFVRLSSPTRGREVQSIVRRSPACVTTSAEKYRTSPEATAAANSFRTASTCSGATTSSQNSRPQAVESSCPVMSSKAGLTPSQATRPSGSATNRRFGVARATTPSRSRWRTSSSRDSLALGHVEAGDDPPVQALAVEDVVDRAVHDQLLAGLRQPAALDLLGEAARLDPPHGRLERLRVLGVDEDLGDGAAPDPLVVVVPGEALRGVVEADDRALLVAEHEHDRRRVHDRAGERLLVLYLAQAFGQLALEPVRGRDVADDGDDLVPAARGHAGLEQAALPADFELVLERLGALRRHRPLDAGHDAVDDVLREEVADVAADHLLAGADEAARIAGDVGVRPIAIEPDHQVRDRVEQRLQPGLVAPELVQAGVLRAHRNSAAIRAPESSALGTNPLAPLSSTSDP